MPEYIRSKIVSSIPRLPLTGFLDVTYRCNNNCRHCWLKLEQEFQKGQKELSLEEIKRIIDEAREMGCREWHFSGGEPMLRPDFADIIEYLNSKSISYFINTNGTLITPEIARLVKTGTNLIALYGATAEVHDHITRNPGSFEATMRGFAYMKEAGAKITVQVIPMRDNYHQFDDMVRLAESLGPHWRIGSIWLYLSACGDPEKNQEIMCQRLDPKEVVEMDRPIPTHAERLEEEHGHSYSHTRDDDRILASCIDRRRDFHIDPYGQMTFCSFIREPSLRYELRKGTFREAWEEFIPSLADTIRVGKEYFDNCGSCELRKECLWCPVYGYLEHGRFSARVEYLCDVARESRKFKEEWKRTHRRHYQIAGITIQVNSDLPITDSTFKTNFELFRVDGPGEDTIIIQHHFFMPDLSKRSLGKEIYRRHPWVIYRKENSWIYTSMSGHPELEIILKLGVFSHDYTRAKIYTPDDTVYRKGNLGSLTTFPTDQILLAQVLADREACYIHSSGVIMNGKGLLFVGHADAGKSTMAAMLRDEAEILCDDRLIVRRWPEGYMLHGTWSHGDIQQVSSNSAPLRAILFLEQAPTNQIIPFDDKREITRRLLACLAKPLVTDEWWRKMLVIAEKMIREIPFYVIRFDKSGRIADELKSL